MEIDYDHYRFIKYDLIYKFNYMDNIVREVFVLHK